jgi:hypothetical protein
MTKKRIPKPFMRLSDAVWDRFLVFLKIILVFLICHVKQTAQE